PPHVWVGAPGCHRVRCSALPFLSLWALMVCDHLALWAQRSVAKAGGSLLQRFVRPERSVLPEHSFFPLGFYFPIRRTLILLSLCNPFFNDIYFRLSIEITN